MTTPSRTTRSWATATVDTVAVFLAAVVILFPVTDALGTVIGLPSGGIRVVIGVVAFGVTYPVVAGEWSMGTLGEYFFAFVAATFVVLGLAGAVPTFEAVDLSAGDSIARVGLWCVVHVTAYVAVASGVTRRAVSSLAGIFWTLVSFSGAYLGVGMLITAERAGLPGYAFAVGLIACSVTLFYLTWA